MAEDLKLQQKIYDMMLYAWPVLAQFPKSEKFTLVADIKRNMDVLMERCIEAKKKYYKKTTLQDEKPVTAIIEVRVRPEREGGFDRIARRLSKFPQVTALYLMSGRYDLMLEVRGTDLNEVASFVSSKLSTIDGVLSTATHFLLKKYKEAGTMLLEEERDERLKIVP